MKVSPVYARNDKLVVWEMGSGRLAIGRLGLSLDELAMAKLRQMLARGSTTETVKAFSGKLMPLTLKDFMASEEPSGEEVVVEYPDAWEQVLVDIQALMRVENETVKGAPRTFAPTYSNRPQAVLLAARRFVAAVYTGKLKKFLGVKIAVQAPKIVKKPPLRASV